MNGINPQPVLRLVAGSSRQMVRVFTPGVAVPPFSIGTHADWVVDAAGVEPIHFFASFDGAQLHVAIGSPTARLSVRLNAVGREWVLAQPPSALVFGEACLALSQEVIPGWESPYASLGGEDSHRALPFGRFTGSGFLGTNLEVRQDVFIGAARCL